MSPVRLDVAPLGRFAAQTRLADVPANVQQGARLLLLDTLGALVGGLAYPAVQALTEALRAPEPASVPDEPFGRLVVLGTAATWLDADSGGSFHPQGHRLPPVPTAHPAPHALPVLLHAAAAGDVPDERLLEAFLLATEIGLRFGTATTLRPGLHPHGIHGPEAAGVAAAVLRGQSAEQIARTILVARSAPLAATLATPMRGGTVRNLWTGLGSFAGAQAAGRVDDGVHADGGLVEELLDGAVCTDLDAAALTDGLGRRWRLLDSYLKPYACARWIHPALDAWRAAVRPGQDPASVERVEVETFAFAASLTDPRPSSDLHARFSLPVCLATLALDGELVAGSFLPQRLARPELAELAARVTVREVPELTAALPTERPTRVTVHRRDRSSSTATVRNARGNPDDPLDAEEVEHKFRRNVQAVLSDARTEDVVTGLLHPERDGNPRSLAAAAREVVGRLCP